MKKAFTLTAIVSVLISQPALAVSKLRAFDMSVSRFASEFCTNVEYGASTEDAYGEAYESGLNTFLIMSRDTSVSTTYAERLSKQFTELDRIKEYSSMIDKHWDKVRVSIIRRCNINLTIE